MSYRVELFYGYEDGESGIYHSFIAVDPDELSAEKTAETVDSLAESLGLVANHPDFHWDSMGIRLPDSVVKKIKEEGVRELFDDYHHSKWEVNKNVRQSR